MPAQNHNLIKEFPELREKIHQLKTSDAYFKKLFDAYDAVEHEVQKIEQAGVNTSDLHLEELRKKRLKLKDEIYTMLRAA